MPPHQTQQPTNTTTTSNSSGFGGHNNVVGEIKKTLMMAITHDEQQQHWMALMNYLKCMEQISSFVQAEMKTCNNFNHLSDQSMQLIKYSEQSIERITSLSAMFNSSSAGGGGGHQQQTVSPPSSNNSSFNSPSIKPAATSTTTINTNSTIPTTRKTNTISPTSSTNSHSLLSHAGKPLLPSSSTTSPSTPQTSSASSNILSNTHSSPPSSSNASSTNNIATTASYHSNSTINITAKQDVSKILKMKRKEYEKQRLTEMKEQMIKSSLERARQAEMRNNVESFLERIQNKKRAFRWKEQDHWSKFIDTYFNYQNMDPLLIEQDRVFLEAISKPSILMPIVAVSQGTDMADMPVDSQTEQKIRQHVSYTLINPSHTLSQICLKFYEYFGELCNSSKLIQNPDLNPKQLISKCVNDIQLFIDKLSMVLFGKYWEMPSHSYEDIVIDTITDTMWGNGIYAKLLFLYLLVYGEENNSMNDKMAKCTTITLQALKLPEKFLLEKDKHPFEKTIAVFKEFDSTTSFTKKVDFVCLAMNQVSKDVNDYYLKYGFEPGISTPIIVGADDLLPIFIYVVAKSNITDLFVKFQMMSELVPEYAIKGEAGYGLATLETAMNCLMSFGNEEIREFTTLEQIRNELENFESKLGGIDDLTSVCSEYQYYEEQTQSSPPTPQTSHHNVGSSFSKQNTTTSGRPSFQQQITNDDLLGLDDEELDLDDI